MVSPNLTDFVAAGGSDGLVDHLLTHDAVECLLNTTQQTSLREGNNVNEYTVQHNAIEQYSKPNDNKQSCFVFSQDFLEKTQGSFVNTYNNTVIVPGVYCMPVHVPIS